MPSVPDSLLPAILGGLLPMLVRVWHWARMTPNERVAAGLDVAGLTICALIQMTIAAIISFVMPAMTTLEAFAVGYAGPDFVSRLVSSWLPKIPGGGPPAGFMPGAPAPRAPLGARLRSAIEH